MNASPYLLSDSLPVERHEGATLCPMCRNEVLVETNFCPACGTAVDAPGVIDDLPQAKVKSTHAFELLLAIFFSIYAVSNAVAAIMGNSVGWPHVVQSLYFTVFAFIFARRWSVARKSCDLAN